MTPMACWLLTLPLLLPEAAAMTVRFSGDRHASDTSPANATTSSDDDGTSTVLVVNSAMLVPGYFTFFLLLYFVMAMSSFSFVRYRTGMPILFLVLILVFPPSFFFLLVYLLILRIGFLTTAWYVLDQDLHDVDRERGKANASTDRSTRSRTPRERI